MVDTGDGSDSAYIARCIKHAHHALAPAIGAALMILGNEHVARRVVRIHCGALMLHMPHSGIRGVLKIRWGRHMIVMVVNAPPLTPTCGDLTLHVGCEWLGVLIELRHMKA
jgi:hypothetical protein